MSGTTAFAVKKRLRDLMDADSPDADATFLEATVDPDTDEPLPIWYGYKVGESGWPREVIWLGEIEWDDEFIPAVGAQAREEQYIIVVTISVHHPGDSQEEANDRAEELMQAFEMLVRDPRWTQVSGVRSTLVEPKALGEGAQPDGYGAIMILTLRVTARI